METIKPQENQNIFDIALQEYGSVEGLFDFLEDNSIDRIDDKLSVYKEFEIKSQPTRREIKEFYTSREILPATDATAEELALLIKEDKDDCVGIGCMVIEDDFVVCPPEGGIDSQPVEINGLAAVVGQGIVVGSIENIGYRKFGTGELPTTIAFSPIMNPEYGPFRFMFSISVIPNTVYEIVAVRGMFQGTIAVSVPIDKNKSNSNAFNSSEVLEVLSQGGRFEIKFLVESQQS